MQIGQTNWISGALGRPKLAQLLLLQTKEFSPLGFSEEKEFYSHPDFSHHSSSEGRHPDPKLTLTTKL